MLCRVAIDCICLILNGVLLMICGNSQILSCWDLGIWEFVDKVILVIEPSAVSEET